MKVLHDKGIFSIDGITVINPELLNLKHSRLSKSHYIRPQTDEMILKDDDSFDLPENIIAELECQHKGIHNTTCIHHYRLKLKEPLVDSVMTLRTFDYKYEREKYIKSIKRIEDCPFSDMVKNMDEQNPLVDTGSKETQDLLLLKSWFEKHYPKDMPYCPFNWAGIIDRAVESITRK